MSNNKKIITSFFWAFLERGGSQGIQFVVQIVLARFLLPEEYGMIAFLAVFIALANIFVTSGLNTALIQKKDVDSVDFSSIFYISFLVATLLYITLFFVSPYIASFYEEPELMRVLRILALTLFPGAFNSIQKAYIARNMMFKKLFFSSFVATIISGVIGIVLAYHDFGVWALTVHQLVRQVTIVIILFFIVEWRPRLIFSFKRFKSLFSYGSKLLVSSLLDTLYNNISILIIGRWYDTKMLGFFHKGQQFPSILMNNIDGSIQSVIFPALSIYQDDKKKVKKIAKRALQTSSFITFPMMVGLAVVAEILISLLLTEAWLPAVPFLQIFCISFALWPIHTANLQVINAIGRSDIFLKLEIIKKILGITIIIFSTPFGALGMAWGIVISGVLSTAINAIPNSKLIDYSYIEQLKDLFPILIISLVMGAVVSIIQFLNFSNGITIITQVPVGIAVYISLSAVFRIESLDYLRQTIKKYRSY